MNNTAARTVDPSYLFVITYSTGTAWATASVYMLRHDDFDGVEFTVRDAATGRSLGAGSTKEEAEFSAEINLSQKARGLVR